MAKKQQSSSVRKPGTSKRRAAGGKKATVEKKAAVKKKRRAAARKKSTKAAQSPASSTPTPGRRKATGQGPGPEGFPIVGMGASAGGLEALETFFKAMPVDAGMGFVLVVHLDPTHISILPELLQKHTGMPVHQIEDGMPVERDHVYVIPPNKDLTILHGTLNLMELTQPRGANLPIDSFFRSLAQDQHGNAVCIILSGTGNRADRSRGTKVPGKWAMTNRGAKSNQLAELRKRAEDRLRREARDLPDMSPEEARELVHELRTHQIELEMQNEELRRAQDELVESRNQYSDLYELAPVGYLTISEKGLLLQANLTAAEMLGVDRADLTQTPLSAFVSGDDQDIYYLHHRQLLKSGERQTCELRMRRAGGDPFWAEMESTVTVAPDAGDRQIRSAIIDVSQRKQTREELLSAIAAAETANQAKTAFLGNVSHEVRTPLTVIMSLVDVLMSHETPPEQWREHLQTVHRSAELLLAIIDDILDLSKIEAKRIELERTDCSLREIVEQVRALMQVRAAEKKLALDVDYELRLPDLIRSDRTRLKQILINLLSNAIKFTEKGGVKMSVRCVETNGGSPRLQFEVADTGIGMTFKEIEQVFEPFTQADASDTRPFSGTGLGLSISRKLAKLLGGEIKVQSQPGQGSTFTLTVDPGPLKPTSANRTTAASAPRPQERFSPSPPKKFCGRVLLADDVPEIQTSLRLLFETLDLELDVADDGRIAQQKTRASQVEGRPYDLILMDIQMPAIDGYEATRRLRQEGWEGPIVALTAHAMAGDEEKCLAAGCNGYLPKPFRRDELLAILAEHLDQVTTPSGD